jgi:O-acetyl-ADP-ribose deacetylase (regulator of RNase III)/uncharacterized protein YwgA
MIRVLIGDLFASKAQTLVNTVNCVGVMGKGIALEFRRRFPEMHRDYVERCREGKVRLGEPYLFKRAVLPWILNFPTKHHWREVARLDSIVQGLEHLARHYRAWGITSLAVPPLGCGQGQLEWRIVGPTLYRHLQRLDIPVEIYAPFGTPHEELEPEFLSGVHAAPPSRVPPGWVALAEIVRRIDEQAYHWPIGRTTFQKIAYVATEEGLPTGLEFRAGSYGPFASQLKKLTTVLVNNGLIREEQLGRMFVVRPGPTLPDALRAFSAELQAWNNLINRVAELFMRMNTARAEIAASVLFAARSLAKEKGAPPSEEEVLAAVMRWKQRRKPPLNRAAVAETVRSLAGLGWLDVTPSPDLPVFDEINPRG